MGETVKVRKESTVDLKAFAEKNKGKRVRSVLNEGILVGYNEKLRHLIMQCDDDKGGWKYKFRNANDVVFQEYKGAEFEYRYCGIDHVED